MKKNNEKILSKENKKEIMFTGIVVKEFVKGKRFFINQEYKTKSKKLFDHLLTTKRIIE
tara:strand:+ start:515 stop:691 length:177 start_codon:yes stop_codon:yes gene_type:complete